MAAAKEVPIQIFQIPSRFNLGIMLQHRVTEDDIYTIFRHYALNGGGEMTLITVAANSGGIRVLKIKVNGLGFCKCPTPPTDVERYSSYSNALSAFLADSSAVMLAISRNWISVQQSIRAFLEDYYSSYSEESLGADMISSVSESIENIGYSKGQPCKIIGFTDYVDNPKICPKSSMQLPRTWEKCTFYAITPKPSSKIGVVEATYFQHFDDTTLANIFGYAK